MARDQAAAVAARFGENLVDLRRGKNLSQERLAVRASLHRTEIGLLEHGERVPRIDTLIRLAGAMGVTPGELLDGIGWIPGQKAGGAFSFDPASGAQSRPCPEGDPLGPRVED